jgi:pimeloyl-ACP methyl ester carboxylesterase
MHRAEALDVLPGVIAGLGLHRPILFGHSDGASIALIYAAANPQLVAGLVLLAPHVFVESMCIASIEDAKRSYLTTDFKAKLAHYHDDADMAFWSWNNIWLDPVFRAWNIEQVLTAISCPVLAVQGYEDEYGTMEQLERLRRGIPCLQSLKLRGCRHSPHRDQPEAVLRAVAAWALATATAEIRPHQVPTSR